QQSASGITIDSTCTVGGKTTSSHAAITGSFDSAYSMTVTSDSATAPGGKSTITMNAKWLGPCAADQKPGDMIMGNGTKMNILDRKEGGGHHRAGCFSCDWSWRLGGARRGGRGRGGPPFPDFRPPSRASIRATGYRRQTAGTGRLISRQIGATISHRRDTA